MYLIILDNIVLSDDYFATSPSRKLGSRLLTILYTTFVSKSSSVPGDALTSKPLSRHRLVYFAHVTSSVMDWRSVTVHTPGHVASSLRQSYFHKKPHTNPLQREVRLFPGPVRSAMTSGAPNDPFHLCMLGHQTTFTCKSALIPQP